MAKIWFLMKKKTKKKNKKIQTFQDTILNLQKYWITQGCVVLQPYDIEVGAGTCPPATFLRAIGPEPWNAAYVASMDWQKDVWHIPEFFELLTQQQEEFDKAITGQQDARTTLNNIAEFQQELLEEVDRIN